MKIKLVSALNDAFILFGVLTFINIVLCQLGIYGYPAFEMELSVLSSLFPEYRELIIRYSIIIIYTLCCIFYLIVFKPLKKYSEMSLLLPKAVIYIISLIAVVMLIVIAFLIYKFQLIQTGNSIALFICIEMANMGITLLGINLKRYQG